MRSAHMNNALLVIAPADFWLAAHLAENQINFFNRLNAVSFKNAVGNASPSVIRGKFYLNTKTPNSDIREGLRVWVEIDRNRDIAM